MTADGGAPERDHPPNLPAYPPMLPVAMGAPAGPAPSWSAGLRPETGELRAAVRLAGLLLLSGVPLGVLWWLIAPRRAYLVAAEGAFAVVPESEAAVGSDGWFMVLTGVTAVLAAFLAWRFLPRRGPSVVVALAVGPLLCGLMTWGVGGLLGSGPTATDLSEIGATVLGPLDLGAQGTLTVAPFLAVTGYLIGACFTTRDDLGRSASGTHARARPVDAAPVVARDDAPPYG